MTDPDAPRDVVDFQLAVLDAYEKLLASCSWDESRLNEALKSMMSSMFHYYGLSAPSASSSWHHTRSWSGNTAARSKPRCASPTASRTARASGPCSCQARHDAARIGLAV